MKRALLGGLLAFLAATCSASDEMDLMKALREAAAARAKGDLKEAEAAYNRALDSDPLCDGAWHGRGLVRRLQGNFKHAIEDLDQAIELNPEEAGYHNDLGLAKADDGDLAGAIASYDTALRLAPDSALIWNNRSFAKRLTGDVDAALKDATMALQLDPKYARAYLNRGLCLCDLREWEDALADLEKSVELEAEGQDYTRLRIWILRARMGKKDAAEKDLREWLKLRKPGGDRVESYGKFLLGEVKEDALLADAAGSLDWIERVRKAEAHFFAGSKALVDGKPEIAKAHFQAAVETGVKNTEIIRSVQAELEGLAPRK